MKVPVDTKDQCVPRVAQSCRILRHSIQNWLHVRRRTGGLRRRLARRRLLLQRFLEFLEQSHVLDGDDCLISESFTSSICLSLNGSDNIAPNRKDPDRGILTQ